MRKLLIGFLLLSSISSFAGDVPRVCEDGPRQESYIENQNGKDYKLDVVYFFANSARDLYIKIEGIEKVDDGTGFLRKEQSDQLVSCLRQDRKNIISGDDCASFQCSIVVIHN